MPTNQNDYDIYYNTASSNTERLWQEATSNEDQWFITEASFSLVAASYWCNDEVEHSLLTLRPEQLYTKAQADCSDRGGIFTPLIDNSGHQPVLSKMRRNATQLERVFHVWTGLSRLNATHFTDKNGTWLHTDQTESCKTECHHLYALFANINDGGDRLEWSNDIMRAGPIGLRY